MSLLQHLEDARHQDGTVNEAVQQIAFADLILLNKIDLVKDAASKQQVLDAIQGINNSARIIECQLNQSDGRPPMDLLLLNNLFSVNRVLEVGAVAVPRSGTGELCPWLSRCFTPGWLLWCMAQHPVPFRPPQQIDPKFLESDSDDSGDEDDLASPSPQHSPAAGGHQGLQQQQQQRAPLDPGEARQAGAAACSAAAAGAGNEAGPSGAADDDGHTGLVSLTVEERMLAAAERSAGQAGTSGAGVDCGMNGGQMRHSRLARKYKVHRPSLSGRKHGREGEQELEVGLENCGDRCEECSIIADGMPIKVSHTQNF